MIIKDNLPHFISPVFLSFLSSSHDQMLPTGLYANPVAVLQSALWRLSSLHADDVIFHV